MHGRLHSAGLNFRTFVFPETGLANAVLAKLISKRGLKGFERKARDVIQCSSKIRTKCLTAHGSFSKKQGDEQKDPPVPSQGAARSSG